MEDEDQASDAVASEDDLSPDETAYAKLESEEGEKIKTLLSSASVPVSDATSYLHDDSILENATFISSLSRLPFSF